jgi:GNAT superfamily N-acetyltransferase
VAGCLLPPEPLQPHHRLNRFDCGKPALSDWLRAHAPSNEGKASRTFVVPDEDGYVCGYYTLATGSVARTELPRKLRHNLPNPAPVMVLGRLAVDRLHHGSGIGAAMLREALTRTLRVAEQAGVRALIVHAIDDDAVNFYTRYGFQIFPPETRTLLLPVETITAAVTIGPAPTQG